MSKQYIARHFDDTNFSQIQLIGNGVFGKIYKSHDKKLNTTVVIKLLSKRNHNFNEKKILAEVGILSQLKYQCGRSILCYLDFMEDDDNFYIITEYLGEYITLLEFINQTMSSLSEKKLVKIIENLKYGLVVCHQSGVAHRDIKPENVMINKKNLDIKYIDFGLSCQFDTCYNNDRVGSPEYVAPEVVSNGLSPNTLLEWFLADYWSLGMTICALLFKTSIVQYYAETHLGSEFFDAHNKFLTIKTLNEIKNIGISKSLFKDLCVKRFHSQSNFCHYLLTSVQPLLRCPPNSRVLYIDRNLSVNNPRFEEIELTLGNDNKISNITFPSISNGYSSSSIPNGYGMSPTFKYGGHSPYTPTHILEHTGDVPPI